MARSIVLRFDATCVDCGSSIPAGSTARWFGRGRVSCCGKGAPAAPASLPPKLAPSSLPRIDVAAVYSAAVDRVDNAPDAMPKPAPRPWADDAPPHPDAEIVRALATGLSPAQVARIAQVGPQQRLLVRLVSGARFVVAARDCAHVIRCVEESMIDKVRDVMGAGS